LITPYHMCSPSLVFNVWFGLVWFTFCKRMDVL
jgi:hypothetical protein